MDLAFPANLGRNLCQEGQEAFEGDGERDGQAYDQEEGHVQGKGLEHQDEIDRTLEEG